MTDYVGNKNPKYSAPNGMTVYEIVKAYGLNFWEGNACKYLIRWQGKNGVEDLRKARSYIDELIRMEEAGTTIPRQPPTPSDSGQPVHRPAPGWIMLPDGSFGPGLEIPGQLPLFCIGEHGGWVSG